eukprot:c20027_g2_i1 orf=286-981(+)
MALCRSSGSARSLACLCISQQSRLRSLCITASGGSVEVVEPQVPLNSRWWKPVVDDVKEAGKQKASGMSEGGAEVQKTKAGWWHPGSKVGDDVVKLTKRKRFAILRKSYANEVSSLRKKYFAEMEAQRKEKARLDAVRLLEIQKAKKLRLEQKKERSEIRAREVEEERQILQAELAKERAEKAEHRKAREQKLEERRQKERDIIRQSSAHWIEEDQLELRVIRAILSPVQL